jgi:hypothetical protein
MSAEKSPKQKENRDVKFSGDDGGVLGVPLKPKDRLSSPCFCTGLEIALVVMPLDDIASVIHKHE